MSKVMRAAAAECLNSIPRIPVEDIIHVSDAILWRFNWFSPLSPESPPLRERQILMRRGRPGSKWAQGEDPPISIRMNPIFPSSCIATPLLDPIKDR